MIQVEARAPISEKRAHFRSVHRAYSDVTKQEKKVIPLSKNPIFFITLTAPSPAAADHCPVELRKATIQTRDPRLRAGSTLVLTQITGPYRLDPNASSL
jgi:hypothetical protein